MLEDDNRITHFARTNFRTRRIFGIKRRDRRSHMYLIGKTGVGKSSLLATLIEQDMKNGEGLALIDPHGDLVEQILARIPEHRKADLIYFNVPDRTAPLGFNPMESVPPEKRVLAASGLLDAFKKLWAESWGPRLEHLLRNALLALLDQPEATLADVLRLLTDKEFRKSVALKATNRQVYDFWVREFENYPAHFRAEAIAPIQNKVGAFLANPLLNCILTRPKSAFNLRQVMDGGKILLVNLAKGKIGEDTVALLGALLTTQMGLAALSRADVPEVQRRDFYLYTDEFSSYTTLSMAGMLSELRKYRLNLILAHQFLSQLDEEVRDAILGNVGTMIAFRLGVQDAEILEEEFEPEITTSDLVNLPNFNFYIRLMIDGVISHPFSAETIMHESSPGHELPQ
jgi:type IV secretory pathway TraG/TraD family ATPase VirD4